MLRVTDDGVGFDTTNQSLTYSGHFGLLDMSERVEKMRGRYSMISARGEGTEIRVEVSENSVLAHGAEASRAEEMSAP